MAMGSQAMGAGGGGLLPWPAMHLERASAD
jgi:hypothetical protein